MAIFTDNPYLQSLLESLITTHETEIDYLPVEIELDPLQIDEDDIQTIQLFVSQARKRLFVFSLPGNDQATQNLFLNARRSFLNQTAELILERTSNEPRISPLKKDLLKPPSTVRIAVQIQKGFIVPKQSAVIRNEQEEVIEQIPVPELILASIDDLEHPVLREQLSALNIRNIQDSALEKIREHGHAFTDGLIPNNLPKGFYIVPENQALCYTDKPQRLPTALAPLLEISTLIRLPTAEQIQFLLPTLEREVIDQLLNTEQQAVQREALMTALPAQARDLRGLLSSLQIDEAEFIAPLLVKLFILGGEAQVNLFTQLLKTCLTKNISLAFLKDPTAQDSLLNPRGLKNLQKLVQLPAEQREWWNTLSEAHLQNPNHHFNFNHFFEAYTQIFLTQISDKNLTLPQPCPIQHNGHFLTSLNRVIDVLNKAQNAQEQCINLSELNWGPTGVHFAMMHAPKRFKQVAAAMKLENPESTEPKLATIFQHLAEEDFDLQAWLYRYMGQHWHAGIRLTDIQAQFAEIQTLEEWPEHQKRHLAFLLASCFSEESELNAEGWSRTLKGSITLLKTLPENDRTDLLQALSRSFSFMPRPTLSQIQDLIEQCLALKTSFNDLNFKDQLLSPLFSCLENEGFALINTLQARIQKLSEAEEAPAQTLSTILSFTTLLQNQRQDLPTDLIKLLAALNEPEITEQHILELNLALESLRAQKSNEYGRVLLDLLAKINISKSQALPNVEQVKTLIISLANLQDNLPEDCNSPEKEEKWLKDLFIDHNFLPGCVLGDGDISKLDDLIVDALADAIKKRSAILKIDDLKASLGTVLQSNLVPQQLKDQLNRELWPLFDAFKELVELLQTPNPEFEQILAKFRFFEEKKVVLLQGNYSVSLLGQSKGEYLLSLLLTGQKKPQDNITGSAFVFTLSKVHGLIASEINAYFADEQNRNAVKELDAATSLKWMATFNERYSVTFLFKEELVEKKVLPALRKTLVQLNTQDVDFENAILAAAADLAEDKPSDYALRDYKIKIESIASYLNLLIDIKDRFPVQFQTFYKALSTGALGRLNYSQKERFISKLLVSAPGSLDRYLKLAAAILEDNPEADETAISRAINGLNTLFDLEDLEPETQIMFFKMSMSHNLKNPSSFPLAILNELKKANMDEETKSLIIKQIIQILSQMTDSDSPDLIQGLIHQTQAVLAQSPEQAPLCFALLKRVSSKEFNRDIGAYCSILQQLTSLQPEKKEKLAVILTGLAKSKKDDSVNLPTLLDISKGLGRRTPLDLEQVLQLFQTPPYPIAQRLNTVLLAHGSEKLQAYCQSFDSNPFVQSGKSRDLAKQFATDRIEESLLELKDLMHGVKLPHALQLQLARQLTYIETLGYTDPLNPYDFQELKKLTASSRQDLKERATELLILLRSKAVPEEQLELVQLELLAHLREIYFRSTGLFPNSTQMLVLLLSLQSTDTNLLMRIKTGEGKSLITPIFAILQWAQGGTVDVCTANGTLLDRDYENSCEPFFTFLGIKSALIKADSRPEDYQLGGINCSTVEDMALFRLAAKEARKEQFIQNEEPIHLILDECDDALLDQNTLYKLVAENIDNSADNPSQWIYPLAYQFINLPTFRNIDPAEGKIWDEEEDLEQFRLFINKEINEKFNGDAEKQNFIMAATNTQLKEWINASCKAALLVENKHYIVRPIKEKDETGTEVTTKIVCIPLVKSVPKPGIIPDGVQQALQARLIAERKDQARFIFIDPYPPVLASQSARGLVRFYQDRKGRIIGISGTPGDSIELQYLGTQLGTQAIGVAPHAGDKRTKHEPIFTFSKQKTISAIHQAIDTIKLPVTRPRLQFEADTPIQTLEEREAFIQRTKDAIQEWNKTQTQPILIVCEDFNEAHTIGESLTAYKEAGFTIQVVTGKESSEELERIIKRAGQANTITIGTAMLARGIDINPGEHPEGLFVIQAYADSKRVTTQIAGRAARNGKPGQWLPIYEIEPAQSWLKKLAYYLFPWYRRSKCQEVVTQLQNEIKVQANVDRLYTQAIDQAQQTLLQQIYAWESLLLELRPDDQQIKYELYQWRETLLSELSQAQETSVSKDTLELSITEFHNALNKIWESNKEEKWAAKAQSTMGLNIEQELRVNYLKQLDLKQELNIQRALEQKAPSFKEANKALMHQNLKSMIIDKAGAVLEYTNPAQEEKRNLQLAQSRQLLPSLISELCSFYPQVISEFSIEEEQQDPDSIVAILGSVLHRVHEHGNQVLFGLNNNDQIIQSISQYYQNDLAQASPEAICDLLQKVKPLILGDDQTRTKMPLIDKFKMQGLVLTFCKLYDQSGLPNDPRLDQLKISYSDEVMKILADRLLRKFRWVKQSPQPIHAFFERTAAKQAADRLYDLAEDLRQTPADQNKIRALYTCLQKERLNLQDLRLFSIGHKSPRDVIAEALTAMEALHVIPQCDRDFQDSCHDKILFSHHLKQFDDLLENIDQSFRNTSDPVWEHLNGQLQAIIASSGEQSHVITELYEAIDRFRAYPAYQPYQKHLGKMHALLADSSQILQEPNGLKQDSLESLMTQKAAGLADLLAIDANQIRIQSGSDCMKSYIEVQVERAPFIEGFTGYQSPYTASLDNEMRRVSLQREKLEQNREALLNLSNPELIQNLSLAKKAGFERLFRLKPIIDLNWIEDLENRIENELPASIHDAYQYIQRVKQWEWTYPAANFTTLQEIFADNLRELSPVLLEKYADISEAIEKIKLKMSEYELKLKKKQEKITSKEALITTYNKRLDEADCSFSEKFTLNSQILGLQAELLLLRPSVIEPQKLFDQATIENTQKVLELKQVITQLRDEQEQLINLCEHQAKLSLAEYIQQEAQDLFESLEQEFLQVDSTIEELTEKEQQKSHYQTRRFYTAGEFLKYQASLAKEEEQIPAIQLEERIALNRLVRTFFNRNTAQETEVNPSPAEIMAF